MLTRVCNISHFVAANYALVAGLDLSSALSAPATITTLRARHLTLTRFIAITLDDDAGPISPAQLFL
ncbi:unnamed protein product [Pieris macdunnoughi]|uniref:Uncharacterized protein n=1 Tax=Pieris macdunnoughi TaxID=345717 RepID=A0A821V8E2_9NEOP|nr:unnamed protein product [Pieris macdunnoughi]